MHLFPKLFFGEKHPRFSCMYAQTFILEIITTNEWIPTADKPKLFTTHIFPSIYSQTILWKQQQYAITTIYKCNFVLSTSL
jgi:hypothetical protein